MFVSMGEQCVYDSKNGGNTKEKMFKQEMLQAFQKKSQGTGSCTKTLFVTHMKNIDTVKGNPL